MNDLAKTQSARGLWYVARGQAQIRPATLTPFDEGACRVRTLWSGLSRGTERLVFEGKVSMLESERMRAPFQEGDFPYPVKYGYCAVGTVTEGPEALVGQTVFALHPHQDQFVLPAGSVRVVPSNIPARRAILTANMETALNALWDSGAGAGDRIVVVGGGVVGCLVAYLAGQLPGAEVTLVDIDLSRKAVAEMFGCAFSKPLDAPGEADVVFHASATASGLSCALACAGVEAKIVEMSWFGDEMVPAPLGLDFHSRRLTLVSSQVGLVATTRRARWDYARRMEKALALLNDDRLDALISEEIAFNDLPQSLPRLFAPGAPGLTAAVRY